MCERGLEGYGETLAETDAEGERETERAKGNVQTERSKREGLPICVYDDQMLIRCM